MVDKAGYERCIDPMPNRLVSIIALVLMAAFCALSSLSAANSTCESSASGIQVDEIALDVSDCERDCPQDHDTDCHCSFHSNTCCHQIHCLNQPTVRMPAPETESHRGQFLLALIPWPYLEGPFQPPKV